MKRLGLSGISNEEKRRVNIAIEVYLKKIYLFYLIEFSEIILNFKVIRNPRIKLAINIKYRDLLKYNSRYRYFIF